MMTIRRDWCFPIAALALALLGGAVPPAAYGQQADAIPGATQAAKPSADPPASPLQDDGKPASPGRTIATRQERLSRTYAGLEAEIVKLSEYIAATDPQRAALLRKALRLAREQAVSRNFDGVVDRLRQDRVRDFEQAIADQKRIEGDLKLILELLASENRAKRLESEKARIREYIKQIDRMIKQQEGLQGRTQGGEDAERLAESQRKLAEQAKKLADQIKENEEPQANASGDEPKSDASDNAEPGKSPKPEGQNPGDSKQPGDTDPKDIDPKDTAPKDTNPKDSTPDAKKPPGDPSDPQSDKPPRGDKSDTPSGEPGQPNEGQPKEGQPGQNNPPMPGQAPGQPGDAQPPPPADPANPARRRVEAAQQRMEDARQKLEEAQRDGAVEDQEKALQELNKALADLEKILRQLREEEIERVLTMLEVRFQKMLKLQTDVYKGTTRIDKIPAKERDRDDEIETSRLARLEQTIVAEADRALTLLNDDGSVAAFPVALGQVRDDMAQVAGLLANVDVGPVTQGIEEDVIASLEEMIEALKKAIKDQEKKRQQGPQQPGQGGEMGDPALVDTIAELKMIRSLQMRINRRTTRFREMIAAGQGHQSELVVALRRLAEREQEVYQIVRDISLGRNR